MGKQLKTIKHDIPVLPVFADARNNNTQVLITCMFCQKKFNICINKILIYNLKLNDFVHLFYPKPVQNIITIKPPCVNSAHNDVPYFRQLGEFDMGRSISLQKV